MPSEARLVFQIDLLKWSPSIVVPLNACSFVIWETLKYRKAGASVRPPGFSCLKAGVRSCRFEIPKIRGSERRFLFLQTRPGEDQDVSLWHQDQDRLRPDHEHRPHSIHVQLRSEKDPGVGKAKIRNKYKNIHHLSKEQDINMQTELYWKIFWCFGNIVFLFGDFGDFI